MGTALTFHSLQKHTFLVENRFKCLTLNVKCINHSYQPQIDQPKLSTMFFESQASQSDGRRAVRTRVSCVSEASSLLERCFAWVIQGVHGLIMIVKIESFDFVGMARMVLRFMCQQSFTSARDVLCMAGAYGAFSPPIFRFSACFGPQMQHFPLLVL